GIHVIPPEHIGTGEGRILLFGYIPDALRLYKVVRLSPEFNFTFVLKIPAVAHYTVVHRPFPGKVSRLRRTGYRRQHRLNRSLFAFGCPVSEKWGMLSY